MEIIERIDRWGRTTPDRPAYVSGGRTLTYGELRRRSDALAAHLAGTLPEKSPVVVLGHKEPELLIAYLGAIKSGRAYVPVDTAVPAAAGRANRGGQRRPAHPHAGEGRRALRRRRSGPPVAAGNGRSLLHHVHLGQHRGAQGGAHHLRLPAELPPVDPGGARLRGGPRGLPQRRPLLVRRLPDGYLSRAGDGGTVASVTKAEVANPKQLYPLLGGSGLTTWVSTPSFAQMCLVEPTFNREMLPRVRRFLFCGETLAPEIASQLLDRFPAAEVWNTYGPTEATVAATSVRITREILDRYSPLPIGYPMLGGRVLVMDEQAPRGARRASGARSSSPAPTSAPATSTGPS